MQEIFIYIGIIVFGFLMVYVCKLAEKVSNNKWKDKI